MPSRRFTFILCFYNVCCPLVGFCLTILHIIHLALIILVYKIVPETIQRINNYQFIDRCCSALTSQQLGAQLKHNFCQHTRNRPRKVSSRSFFTYTAICMGKKENRAQFQHWGVEVPRVLGLYSSI